jgi:hypothetical protein
MEPIVRAEDVFLRWDPISSRLILFNVFTGEAVEVGKDPEASCKLIDLGQLLIRNRPYCSTGVARFGRHSEHVSPVL